MNRGIENSGHLTDLIRLAAPREGHFLLESGHHGNLWLDLNRLFQNPRALAPHVAVLADRIGAHEIEAVCGPLVGGALLAQLIAVELEVGFCFSEVAGRNHGRRLFPVDYGIPGGFQAAIAGKRVVIVDDAINAGSAVGSTRAALRMAGAVPVVVASLLDLDGARSDPPTFDGLPLVSLVALPANRWAPEACPLCAAQIPLEERGD